MWEFVRTFLIPTIVATVVVAAGAALLFDRERSIDRLQRLNPIRTPRTFRLLNSRRQIQDLYRAIFIDDNPVRGGRILLMSNTGGLPEYDPFSRLTELAADAELTIYIAVTAIVFAEWARANPNKYDDLVSLPNVNVYLFTNTVPYKFRIGVHSKLPLAFLAIYHGHEGDRVFVEGITTENPTVIEAIESLYFGLLLKGRKMTGGPI